MTYDLGATRQQARLITTGGQPSLESMRWSSIATVAASRYYLADCPSWWSKHTSVNERAVVDLDLDLP
jgi:hypothetical protein